MYSARGFCEATTASKPASQPAPAQQLASQQLCRNLRVRSVRCSVFVPVPASPVLFLDRVCLYLTQFRLFLVFSCFLTLPPPPPQSSPFFHPPPFPSPPPPPPPLSLHPAPKYSGWSLAPSPPFPFPFTPFLLLPLPPPHIALGFSCHLFLPSPYHVLWGL